MVSLQDYHGLRQSGMDIYDRSILDEEEIAMAIPRIACCWFCQ